MKYTDLPSGTRRKIHVAVIISAALLCLLAYLPSASAATQEVEDSRFCGFVPRDEKGGIKRSSSVTRRFQYLWPCPSTGSRIGACPGWAIDHVIPLNNKGCDAIHNLQWLPTTIKSCPGTSCKDRWERRVYVRSYDRQETATSRTAKDGANR